MGILIALETIYDKPVITNRSSHAGHTKCFLVGLVGHNKYYSSANTDSEAREELSVFLHIMMTSSNGNILRVTGPSPVTGNSLHKGQWRGALMFSLSWAWIHGWANNRKVDALRCHYDVIIMKTYSVITLLSEQNGRDFAEIFTCKSVSHSDSQSYWSLLSRVPLTTSRHYFR